MGASLPKCSAGTADRHRRNRRPFAIAALVVGVIAVASACYGPIGEQALPHTEMPCNWGWFPFVDDIPAFEASGTGAASVKVDVPEWVTSGSTLPIEAVEVIGESELDDYTSATTRTLGITTEGLDTALIAWSPGFTGRVTHTVTAQPGEEVVLRLAGMSEQGSGPPPAPNAEGTVYGVCFPDDATDTVIARIPVRAA